MVWHIEGGSGEVRLFSTEGPAEIRLHGLEDPYGDGYVQALVIDVAMSDLTATHYVTLANADELRTFVRGISDSYAGWDGVREWEGADRDLRIDARHDGRAHVLLSIRIGPGWRQGVKWSVEVSVDVEAGQGTVQLAEAIERFLDG